MSRAARIATQRCMTSEGARECAFLGACALFFAASATATLIWGASMSGMGEMPMPGGWTLSMAWMPMCGQTWLGAAASFLGMWIVMMVAMMLPSLVPMLRRYRRVVGGPDLGLLTALVGTGYFLVWTLAGLVVFPLGAALAAAEMHQPEIARAVPIAAGVIVLLAGMLQFSSWKAHRLTCCDQAPDPRHILPAGTANAIRHGLHLGIRCIKCCANLMAILLAVGVMDPSAMILVTAAITLERLAPARWRVAQAIGAVATGTGSILMAQAAGLG